MRSAQHWKRNAQNKKATTREKSLVAGIALVLLIIVAIMILLFGLDVAAGDEPKCTQAQFMHGGITVKGSCEH